MSADFTTIYPSDGGEPWETECDHCGERFDLDHWGDIENHDTMHREAERLALTQAAAGGPRHRA